MATWDPSEDPHYGCERRFKELLEDYHKAQKIKAIYQKKPDCSIALTITDVFWTPDGLIVYVA